jgi:hypothetical protein
MTAAFRGGVDVEKDALLAAFALHHAIPLDVARGATYDDA